MWVSSRIWSKLVPSGLLRTLLKTLVSSFVAKEAVAQRFNIDARASSRHVLKPPSGPLLTGEGICHVEYQGTLEDDENWFVGSADIKNARYQMRIPGWLRAFLTLPLFSHPKLVTLEKRSTENVLPPTL